MRRYDLADLAAATGLSEAALARHVGLSGSTLKKAREDGLREDAADRYAIRAGLHPLEVWPDFGKPPCASCSAPFVPRDRQSLYCSERCRRREKMRRYRARPHGAENNRRYRRDYLAWERARKPSSSQAADGEVAA